MGTSAVAVAVAATMAVAGIPLIIVAGSVMDAEREVPAEEEAAASSIAEKGADDGAAGAAARMRARGA
jgi:hypothetical protein